MDNKVVGWYVDKAIKTVALPKIEKGENILEAEVPIGKRTMVEWMYWHRRRLDYIAICGEEKDT